MPPPPRQPSRNLPPHPATVAQPKAPAPKTAVLQRAARPAHAATVARAKALHPATMMQRKAPHPAMAVQRSTKSRVVHDFKQSSLGEGTSFGLCAAICIYILQGGIWDNDYLTRNECKDAIGRFLDQYQRHKSSVIQDLMQLQDDVSQKKVPGVSEFSSYQVKKMNLLVVDLWNDTSGTKITGHAILMIKSYTSGNVTIFDPDVGEYPIYAEELKYASIESFLLAEHKTAGNNVHKVVIKAYLTLKKS